jgi:uncharacterized protein YjiS (DUF1127 family)
MNTTSIATGAARAAAWTQLASSRFNAYSVAFHAWRLRRKLRAALDELSDRELKDIGITRDEIDYVAQAALSIDPRFATRVTLR